MPAAIRLLALRKGEAVYDMRPTRYPHHRELIFLPTRGLQRTPAAADIFAE